MNLKNRGLILLVMTFFVSPYAFADDEAAPDLGAMAATSTDEFTYREPKAGSASQETSSDAYTFSTTPSVSSEDENISGAVGSSGNAADTYSASCPQEQSSLAVLLSAPSSSESPVSAAPEPVRSAQ